MGSTNRVVEEDLSESLGRDLEVRRQIKPRREIKKSVTGMGRKVCKNPGLDSVS